MNIPVSVVYVVQQHTSEKAVSRIRIGQVCVVSHTPRCIQTHTNRLLIVKQRRPNGHWAHKVCRAIALHTTTLLTGWFTLSALRLKTHRFVSKYTNGNWHAFRLQITKAAKLQESKR